MLLDPSCEDGCISSPGFEEGLCYDNNQRCLIAVKKSVAVPIRVENFSTEADRFAGAPFFLRRCCSSGRMTIAIEENQQDEAHAPEDKRNFECLTLRDTLVEHSLARYPALTLLQDTLVRHFEGQIHPSQWCKN